MEKILIVDDSAVQAIQLKTILETDYEITIAQTSEDCLSYASSESFSLILLDVVMPDVDGFTLLQKLQEEVITQSVPVILITSLSDIQSEQRGLTLGAVDYITKPFHPMIVKARVKTHINLYRYRKQVEWQSMTDQLTGIANRRRYERYSILKWQEATRLQLPFSICMIDIDRFKVYNDTFGHPAGDKVIANIADALSLNLRRSTDFVARYGGEEFVAIILGSDSQTAFDHAVFLRERIEALNIPHSPSISPYVTVSIGGVTIVPKTDDEFRTYLGIADTMLYDAKRYGRNQVVWCGESMQQIREK